MQRSKLFCMTAIKICIAPIAAAVCRCAGLLVSSPGGGAASAGWHTQYHNTL